MNVDNTGDLINSIVGLCKKLLSSEDPNSRRLFNTYRDIVIGNYSLYLIRLYNNYAKQYSLDANDLVHLPYVHFGTLVSNFNPEGGASFNSYMVLCLHGYIKKFISEDALVYVNPSKKVTLSYVETTKTGKDGEVIEYLHSIEPFDADSQENFNSHQRCMRPLLQRCRTCMATLSRQNRQNMLPTSMRKLITAARKGRFFY